jgi:hypothetical protein
MRENPRHSIRRGQDLACGAGRVAAIEHQGKVSGPIRDGLEQGIDLEVVQQTFTRIVDWNQRLSMDLSPTVARAVSRVVDEYTVVWAHTLGSERLECKAQVGACGYLLGNLRRTRGARKPGHQLHERGRRGIEGLDKDSLDGIDVIHAPAELGTGRIVIDADQEYVDLASIFVRS